MDGLTYPAGTTTFIKPEEVWCWTMGRNEQWKLLDACDTGSVLVSLALDLAELVLVALGSVVPGKVLFLIVSWDSRV